MSLSGYDAGVRPQRGVVLGIVVVALSSWRRPATEQGNCTAERPLAPQSAGGRFIRSAPIIRGC